MAARLSICMTCGRYMKGASHDLDELFQKHSCNLSRVEVKKNMFECIAILGTLDKACAAQDIIGTIPPPPPPPPKGPNPMNDVFKAKFDEVHKELKLKLIGRAEKIEKAQEDHLRTEENARTAQNARENKKRKHPKAITKQLVKRSRKN